MFITSLKMFDASTVTGKHSPLILCKPLNTAWVKDKETLMMTQLVPHRTDQWLVTSNFIFTCDSSELSSFVCSRFIPPCAELWTL